VISFDRLCLALCLAGMPFAYALGSNQNYWELIPRAGIFWVLMAAILLGSLLEPVAAWRTLLPLATGTMLCSTTLLYLGMEHPYRQPQPLRQNTDLMSIYGTSSLIKVPREVAEYVTKLRQMAANGGFRTGDPMFDLTGRYPGALYAIGARAESRAWMIGGYEGSNRLNLMALKRVAPDALKKAWILTEPTGPRALSTDILQQSGLDWPNGYHEVGRIDSPRGEYPESYRQYLYKPVE